MRKRVVSADERIFRELARGIYLEGLATDPMTCSVWFSDVVGGGIYGLDADGISTVFDADRLWTGGVLLNACGAVLSSGEGGIRWNHPRSGHSGWLITELNGEPVNGINEMAPDRCGGMFFGTVDIENVKQAKAPRSTQIWHLAADRRLRLVCDEIGFSNGMAFDQQRYRLYCNDSFKCTWVFDVQKDFTLTNRQKFADKTDADGMALDSEGNVWITGFASRAISRYAADGTELELFNTPGGAVTQMRFSGHDMMDLYINTVPADGGQNLKQGNSMIESKSVLYLTRAPRPGCAAGFTNFVLL